MNEVTRIHLGRQPFTVSVKAHEELKNYLAAIKKQVADKGVVDEVELRMAELLTERGIKGDKVVLEADIDYLKQQLGDPGDFKEGESELPHTSGSSDLAQKRLFRDTDNAMLAGVAAGLGNYFGIEAVWIRIIFAIGTIAWGGGILIYIILWLIVPEAKTSSEKLQMRGKPVNVDSLKEVVDRADIKGAAQRANSTVAPAINSFFRIVLKIIGVGFILSGLMAIFGLIATKTYMVSHHGQLLQDNLFPVGTNEHALLDLSLVLAGLVGLFVVLFGVSFFKRKWPIKGWITGVLLGIFFIGLAVAIALAADVAPNVRDRYNANTHTISRSVQPFTSVNATGDGLNFEYDYATTYSVALNYYGNPDTSTIKTTVVNNVLQINAQNFNWHRNCDMLCIPDTYNMVVRVYSPTQPPIIYSGFSSKFMMMPHRGMSFYRY